MDFNRWLQSRLTAHGFPVGGIDGFIGPVTIAALKAFEAKHGFTVDGEADEMVVKALRASSSAISPADTVYVPYDRDIDPPASAVGGVFPRQRDVTRFYGKVGTNQRLIEIPFDMYLAWDKNVRARRMSIHSKAADSAEEALNEIADTFSAKERTDLGIDLFGGSLNVRKMRGGSRYSMHSWGIAIDFDPERNGLRTKAPKARLSQPDAVPFWLIWEKRGWVSLGRKRNFDFMHIQAARL